MRENPLAARSAGILLHPTSLPGPRALGDLGPSARQFIEFLEKAGQTFWQMLPIHPVGAGDSPYDSSSAFAGATHLISLEDLVEVGLIPAQELAALPPDKTPAHAQFERARKERPPLLRHAYRTFQSQAPQALRRAYESFLTEHQSWVWDYALYAALKDRHDQLPWIAWSPELRRREPSALERAHRELNDEIHYVIFLQFCFHNQWARLHAHARKHGVRLMGDVPMFVAHDSVDVWANQHLFFLDEQGQRTVQAGVPPDYFSEDGQLWGNPLYRWDVLRNENYGWWIDRLRRELDKFDALRIDHFIAFSRYWEVPVESTTAKVGRYVDGPSYDFFEKAAQALGGLPFIAEDLGIVTRDVELLRDHFQLPGMKVLQFAFSPGAEPYLPHHHIENSVCYTGTHDNNTTRGWFESLIEETPSSPAAALDLARVTAFSGASTPGEISWSLIRSLYASKANTAIVPVQDLLSLDASCRMNLPGTATGNWAYRLLDGQLTDDLASRLRAISVVTERTLQK